MSGIILTRGIPASGKSTWSKNYVSEYPENRARINRDDIRLSVFGKLSGLSWDQEKLVTDLEHQSVESLVDSGMSVVIDAMHLRPRYIKDWYKFAERKGISFSIEDFPISLHEAVKRDSQREKSVGSSVLNNIWKKYTNGGKFLPVDFDSPSSVDQPVVEYVPDLSKPLAVIVDIDGTVSHNAGHRGWYEYDKVDQDTPKVNVIRVVRAMHLAGYKIVFVSGRSDDCYDTTFKWLQNHVLPYDRDSFPLFMRKTGDTRKDSIVKSEIFDEHLRYNYHVVASVDDRAVVVAFWRSIGLTCLQVELGDY